MKKVEDYKLLLIDFDGTIARLFVDWQMLKEEIYSSFSSEFNFPEKSLMSMAGIIKKSGNSSTLVRLNDIIFKYESPIGIKNYELLHPELLATTQLKCIVSNNLTSTILKILKEENLPICEVIGIDKVTEMKPSKEAFETIVRTYQIELEDILMIGDTDTDKNFALNCGIDFLHINQYNEQ